MATATATRNSAAPKSATPKEPVIRSLEDDPALKALVAKIAEREKWRDQAQATVANLPKPEKDPAVQQAFDRGDREAARRLIDEGYRIRESRQSEVNGLGGSIAELRDEEQKL